MRLYWSRQRTGQILVDQPYENVSKLFFTTDEYYNLWFGMTRDEATEMKLSSLRSYVSII
jgi:hypothetical protein